MLMPSKNNTGGVRGGYEPGTNQNIVVICGVLLLSLICFAAGVIVGKHTAKEPVPAIKAGAPALGSLAEAKKFPAPVKTGLPVPARPGMPKPAEPESTQPAPAPEPQTQIPPPPGPAPLAPMSTAPVPPPPPMPAAPPPPVSAPIPAVAAPAPEKAAVAEKKQPGQMAPELTPLVPLPLKQKTGKAALAEATPKKAKERMASAETKAAAPEKAAAKKGKGGYAIQVAYFTGPHKQAAAEKYIKKIEKITDLKAGTIASETDDSIRVVLGSFPDSAAAKRQCDELRQKPEFSQCFVRKRTM